MKHHILAIGISKHQESFINPLGFASKDAVDFYNACTNNLGAIGYSNLLTDSEATLSKIRTALGGELANQVAPDDVFIFFFSGHGSTAENLDSQSVDHYLIPFDATTDIPSSSISISFLKQAFDKLKCRATLVFVDSCFSGAINTKGYSFPAKKQFKTVKTFGNTILGTGNISFSACKDDETAIEYPDKKNGLFTHYLLNELTKSRPGKTQFPVSDLFDPVASGVKKMADALCSHAQTPTIQIRLEGSFNFPVFSGPVVSSPAAPATPRYPQLASVSIPLPDYGLTTLESDQTLEKLIDLVIRTNQLDSPQTNRIIFERYCVQLSKAIAGRWEEIFLESNQQVSSIPTALAKFEGAALELIILAGAVAAYGSEAQALLFREFVVGLMDLTKRRSGSGAVIAIPEVIIAEIVYVVGAVSICRGRLDLWDSLLRAPVIDDERPFTQPHELLLAAEVFFPESLGGSAITLGDHLRKVLESYPWLTVLCPKMDGRVRDFQVQSNFLLVLLAVHRGSRMYSDFGRFEGRRLYTLIQKIKFNLEFREQLSRMFGIGEAAMLPKLRELLRHCRNQGLGNYLWSSMSPEEF